MAQTNSSNQKTAYKTTVVIPNYNGMAFLDKCLSSLGDYPIVLVDNGSTDNSVGFVQANYPQVELILNTENKGFCYASNQGIEAAKTPYVFLLNNDTEVETDCIAHLEACMESDSKIFSVQAKMLQMSNPDLIDDAGDLYCALGWAFALGKGKSKERYTKQRNIFAACGGAVLYRKDLLKITGGFDNQHFAYLEDIDLGYRAKIYGYKNVINPEAVVLHVGSGASGSRYNKFKVDLSSRNNVYLFCKNMPLLQLLLNLPLLLLGILIKWLFFVKKKLGKEYITGVIRGFRIGYGENYKKSHVAFRWKHLSNYLLIQLELWWNVIRRFVG